MTSRRLWLSERPRHSADEPDGGADVDSSLDVVLKDRAMQTLDADDITQAVLARQAHARNERLREIMDGLVRHMHAFARRYG